MKEKDPSAGLKRKIRDLEQELSKLREKLEEIYVPLVESTGEANFIVDRECRYLFVTDDLAARLKRPAAEIIGKKYADSHGPETTRIFKAKVAQVFDSGAPVQDEHLSTTQGRHVLRYFYPIKTHQPDGEVRKVAVVAHDITARKEMERHLRISEDRYRDLVENSSDLICTHDLEGKLLSVNRAAEKFIDFNRETLIGKNIRELLDPEIKEKFTSYLSAIRSQGTARGLLRVITSAGEKRVLEYDNNLRTEEVDAPTVRGIAHDVRARRGGKRAE